MATARRLCVAVDLVGFSTRRAEVQAELQGRLRRTLKRAWRENGVHPVERRWQGDGEVALAPGSVDESAFVSGFVRALRIVLRRDNRGLPVTSPVRMRVRVAMHTGAAGIGRPGLVDTGVVRTCRLLDAQPLRAALIEHPDSDVALIVSQSLFEDVIWAERHELARDDFRPVRIVLDHKSFVADAWMHVAASSTAAPVAGDEARLLAVALLMAGWRSGGDHPAATSSCGSAGAGSNGSCTSQNHRRESSRDRVASRR
ncbi:MAG: hypothetical protein AB7J32_19050 [Pseudonocardia sp.]